MNNLNLKNIAEELLDTFLEAGKIAKEISHRGVKITIKADKSPVTDGDLAVDKILKDKKEAMEKGLLEAFSDTKAKWSSPKGGCYTWFEMTDGTDISEVRNEVFNRGVGYIAGDMFAPNGDGQNMARLCFAFEPVKKNYEGIIELASIFKDLKVI